MQYALDTFATIAPADRVLRPVTYQRHAGAPLGACQEVRSKVGRNGYRVPGMRGHMLTPKAILL